MARTDITPVLECKDVSISYYTRSGEIPAVVDFNLTVMPGEAVGIVGESGCGKSTVALAIMQYMGRNGAITQGEIKYMGRDLRSISEDELRDLRGSKISMVYQEPMASLNPSLKIKDQLNEVLIVHEGISDAAASKRSMEMLDAVRLPDPMRIMNSYPHQLSGGQQQRVVIAMALLSEPKLLLLDEPTTALDVTVEAGVVELIKDISKRFGTSMIYISHNLGLILETCDRITVMYSGQAVELGSVEQVFDEMRHPYTRGLLSSIPLPGADRHSHPLVPIRGQLPLPHERPKGCFFGPRCDYFKDGLCNNEKLHMEEVHNSSNHSVRCARYQDIDWSQHRLKGTPSKPIEFGPVVLEVRNMQKYYEVHDSSFKAFLSGTRTRYVKANEKLDFTAREGETVAIVGESGCGKSTFAKVMMGLENATGGEVLLNGVDIGQLPVQKRAPKMVGNLQMVFQNPFETLNPSHSVGAQISRVLRKFGVADSKQDAHIKVFELLDLVKLPRDFAHRKPRQLSGGQKQRIGIARAFGGEAKVVVADEPVSALDVSVQAAVTGLLTDIQREKRTTLIFISHDLSVVRYLADRVVVMYLGQIMEQGTTEEIFTPPYHPYTEALLSAVPIADTSVSKKHIVLSGELPSPMNPPTGCPFQTRCHRKIGSICETEMPLKKEFANGHRIQCHLDDAEFNSMEPVIAFAEKDDVTKAKTEKPGTEKSAQKKPAATIVTPGITAIGALVANIKSAVSSHDTPIAAPLKTAKAPKNVAAKKTVAKKAVVEKIPMQKAATKKRAVKKVAAQKIPQKASEKRVETQMAASKKAKAKKAAQKAKEKKATKKAAKKAHAEKVNAKKTAKKVAKKAAKKAAKLAAAKKAEVKKLAAKKATKNKKQAANAKPKKVSKTSSTVRKTIRRAVKAKPATRAFKMAQPRGGKGDNLKLIFGVGPKIEQTLNNLGIWHFDQIKTWKKADIEWVDEHLTFKGRIMRDQWVKQATALAKGNR